MQNLSVFLLFFGGKKGPAFRSSIYFYPLIIEFFLICLAMIQNQGKDITLRLLLIRQEKGEF